VRSNESKEPPSFKIGDENCSISVDGRSPVFILGPCVIEGEDSVWKIAKKLVEMSRDLKFSLIFKASYDKANRTSIDSFRGPGVKDGCNILRQIGKEFGIPVTTDVHTIEEVEIASEAIDFLQLPAFLCRQTDLITAAGRSGRPVNVKKGQFLSPMDIKPIARKLEAVGCENFLFTERGSTFGYNNLVADMRSLFWIREQGYRVIFDATHSAQLPGGSGGYSSGMREMIPTLAKAAVASGCNGVFMEVHNNVEEAKSDAATQWPLKRLEELLIELKKIHEVVKK